MSILFMQGVCTESGMYALRERRVHVTQEDFEMAVAKVSVLIEFNYSHPMKKTVSAWIIRTRYGILS